MIHRLLSFLLCTLPLSGLFAQSTAALKPRLVVTIAVGTMRAGDLDRYSANFTEGGLRRLIDGGVRYGKGRYDFQQTTSEVTLSTLVTGARPEFHGVVANQWVDYIENLRLDLVADVKTDRLGAPGLGFSPRELVTPTLSDALVQHSPKSRVITVAAEPASAVVMSGREGDALWIDTLRCNWASSNYYYEELPAWVDELNDVQYNMAFLPAFAWESQLTQDKYINSRGFDISMVELSRGKRHAVRSGFVSRLEEPTSFEQLLYTPASNSAVFDMAKKAISQMELGRDADVDLLNISLDGATRIAELYGPESLEVEDMYYALDRDLDDFLTFLFAQLDQRDVLVVFTAAHGTSPSYDLENANVDRFNTRQFEVIINSFMNARYGQGEWVVGLYGRSLYLNHNLIYANKLDLDKVQNEVATFALQFRGISQVLTATTMRNSYFADGYGHKMQGSYYPRRSGDVAINLMPGWIDLAPRKFSSSGSMYSYDTDVPLIFYGAGISSRYVERIAMMESVASTIAQVIGLSEPCAAQGTALAEVIESRK